MAAATAQSFGNMKFTLNNGMQMPAVGIGTYRIRKGDDIMKVVEYALDAGYRLFDTAAVYNNESHLKEAFRVLLPKYGLDRDDIFVTTKLSPSNYGGSDVVHRAYQKSLENLGLDQVDLFLIHFPGVARLNASDVRNQKIREMTWASLEELYDDGRVNAIGVSNFTIRHLDEIASNHSVMPAVNQVEWHPFYHQPELLNYCKEKDIVVQAYCSFGGTSSSNTDLVDHPVVKKIAKKLDVSCAQVLLVWALQQDVAVIPKSTNPERIKENITLNFRIPDEDMKLLNALGEQNTKYAWDPKVVY
ncbi:uncharacterized protein LOC113227679 isoform X2 [Hyposmocoma kahamanoa]|uniref:uncharacterized protein LOC113227679 isoform X2 n=1 Tax=Hyposmocoma kahamanoa TaxID=1477025 RepID=UPI000E6D9BAF|nr:uncharacterized protein LOC113227679 isoform X2 [Hyposmocoma kahamanoa]